MIEKREDRLITDTVPRARLSPRRDHLAPGADRLGSCHPRTTPGPRPGRPEHSRYALWGLLICARCGHMMQGHVVSRRNGAQRLGYQCTYRNDYPGDDSHPTTLFVAEYRVLPAVDHWLADLTSPERLDATVSDILEADRRQLDEPRPGFAVHAARRPTPASGSISTSLRSTREWTLV